MRQGEALDTLRWGDNIPIALEGSAALVGVSSGKSNQQVAKAQWRWPLTWGLRIVATVVGADPLSPAFDVTYEVTIGSGQNSSTATFGPYTITPTAVGVYPTVTDFIQLPAQDVQVTATVVSDKALSVGIVSTVYAGAYLAPITEPHAMTELLDHARGETGGARWMTEHHGPTQGQPGTGQGFPINPDPLHYQQRR